MLDESIEVEAECGDTCAGQYQLEVCQMFHIIDNVHYQSFLSILLVAL